ncbi:MAG: DUF1223 domain-containing protein [Hyphomicrobiaceae bacterium]
MDFDNRLAMVLRKGPFAVFAAMLGLWSAAGPAQQHDAAPAVLELFTSQGCSSCPSADALLKTFAGRKDAVALTLAVDYWDHLGWKDTFANPNHSRRQRAYAKARGDHRVYTPQMVVNGTAHAIGSRQQDIEELIVRTGRELAPARVPLKVSAQHGMIVIETGTAANSAAAARGTIWIARVQPVGEVAIVRGENHGKTLTYYNVVHDLTAAGMWSGEHAGTVRLPWSAVLRNDREKCVVFLQQGTAGAIIAAAWMTRL